MTACGVVFEKRSNRANNGRYYVYRRFYPYIGLTEMIVYEDLGFTRRGKAKEDIEVGTFTLGGELAVNADGGLNCFGHPLGASGLRL